jgi:ATP-dependent DNA helicase DinG
MVQAARGGDDLLQPTRIVFDEAHHLFEAADSALASHLSGRETAELRRWLRGGEDGRRSRRRGLRDRVGDLVDHMAEARDGLECLLSAAGALPGPGWRTRLEGMAPHGPAETFLVHVRQQVFACNRDEDRAYSLETPLRPPVPGLIEAAEALKTALIRFRRPLAALIRALGAHLDDEAANLDTATRARIEGLCRSLEFRVGRPVGAWIQMLGALASDETPAAFVDWLGIERIDGHEADMGFFRHWLDPTKPFAEIVLKPAHGVLLTSASLDDGDWRSGDGSEGSWAERRTGASHLPVPSAKAAFDSPFDYGAQTRILIVGDVGRDDETRVAAAYRELFLASGGGGLGLFTAISRLRAVHRAIAAGLEDAGIRLLAQHVDGMDTGTLIDIFRAEENSCLLGTDAVRDGVDVPGRSLRLIVLDRVPWPRPTLLHRARRDAMGGRAYDETLTRLKLKQAFGRLIRRADDRGVFVLLDRAMPTRLTGAFPDGVPIERLGLADAVTAVRTGLGR